MHAWRVDRWCEPDEMSWLEIERPRPDPGWTLIRVEAVSVNFFDILMVQGKYQFKPPLPFTPGQEVCGVVEEPGPGSKFKKGDRIMSLLLSGGYADFAVAPDFTSFLVPNSMPDSQAAAFQIVYQTSYFGLVHRAGLQKGESLLVLAAAGGVGLAAVQIGKVLGSRVIAAVGSADKFDVCRRAGADEVVNYREEGWVEKVKGWTGGDGVSVIYDPVGGDILDRALKVIAWEGRVVIVGFASGIIPQIAANRILLKNIAVMGIHWGDYRRHNFKLVESTQDKLYALYGEGKIKPIIFREYPLEDAPLALAELGSRKTYGKFILRP